jgi:hypothetical protein
MRAVVLVFSLATAGAAGYTAVQSPSVQLGEGPLISIWTDVSGASVTVHLTVEQDGRVAFLVYTEGEKARANTVLMQVSCGADFNPDVVKMDRGSLESVRVDGGCRGVIQGSSAAVQAEEDDTQTITADIAANGGVLGFVLQPRNPWVSDTIAARAVRTPGMVFGAYLESNAYAAPKGAMTVGNESEVTMRVMPRADEVPDSVWPEPNFDRSLAGALSWSAEFRATDEAGNAVSYGLQDPVPPAYARWTHPSGTTVAQLMLLLSGALFGIVATLVLEALPGGSRRSRGIPHR